MTDRALARRLSFGALVLIGVGDILGAGIYALVGKVIGLAGPGAWVSFLISALLAAATGLTYAELASRVPKAAGAAAYAAAAFPVRFVPFLVGFLVLASGLTSTATVALAVRGYLDVFLPLPQLLAATALIFILVAVAWLGIAASAWTNHALTAFELAGLLVIIGAGVMVAGRAEPGELLSRLAPGPSLSPLLAGATLAFYAFVGFEDLANLAEESKNPERDLPRAILVAVAVTTAIYLAVITVTLWTLSIEQAAASERPLLEVLVVAGFPVPAWAFSVVAIFAISNTGLANFVMVSRLLYGMSAQGLAPEALSRVEPKRRTPRVAILAGAALVFLLIVSGGAPLLAQTTSLLLVTVFTTLHVSLIRLRRRGAPAPFRVPGFVPWIGIIVGLFLFTHFPAAAYARMAVIVLAGGLLYRWVGSGKRGEPAARR